MSNSGKPGGGYRTFVLVLLTLVYGFNFIDRQIVGILAPFIQADLELSDTQIGLLIGLAFAFIYTVMGIPIAWLADRYSRVNILAISLGMWSAFTALTGMANNFVQIGLARMGVGIGEAGGSPPAHSIISDLYAKEERAGALGVYAMGIPLGIMCAYFVTASLIGKSGDEVDWRRIFIILGVAGIALAFFVKLVLKEPKRGAMEVGDSKPIAQATFGEALTTILRIPSWWAMCIGIAAGSFVSYAFAGFQTKYLIGLDPDFNFKTLIIALGVINGVAYAGGTYLGARLSDLWGARDIRAYGWLPAIAIGICLPTIIAGMWVASVWIHLVYTTILLLFLGMYLGPSFAIAQTLAPINMRAMSTALFFFILNIVALGGGPTVAGILSDYFQQSYEPLQALRLSLTVVAMMFVVSVASFLVVSKTLPKDWKEARERNEGTASE